jgi:glutamine synthetase
LSETALAKKSVLPGICCEAEEALLQTLASLSGQVYRQNEALEKALLETRATPDMTAAAKAFSDTILPAMQELRTAVDGMETLMAEKYWPYPTYGDILFRV